MEQAAKQHGITLVGGSIPESSGGNVYNTCLVYNKNGELLAKHRKVSNNFLCHSLLSCFTVKIASGVSFSQASKIGLTIKDMSDLVVSVVISVVLSK